MAVRPGRCSVCGSELEKDKTCTECGLTRENEQLHGMIKRIKDRRRYEVAKDVMAGMAANSLTSRALGNMSRDELTFSPADYLAACAVEYADALLKELDK